MIKPICALTPIPNLKDAYMLMVETKSWNMLMIETKFEIC